MHSKLQVKPPDLKALGTYYSGFIVELYEDEIDISRGDDNPSEIGKGFETDDALRDQNTQERYILQSLRRSNSENKEL